jgi:hypothetical protein
MSDVYLETKQNKKKKKNDPSCRGLNLNLSVSKQLTAFVACLNTLHSGGNALDGHTFAW